MCEPCAGHHAEELPVPDVAVVDGKKPAAVAAPPPPAAAAQAQASPQTAVRQTSDIEAGTPRKSP